MRNSAIGYEFAANLLQVDGQRGTVDAEPSALLAMMEMRLSAGRRRPILRRLPESGGRNHGTH